MRGQVHVGTPPLTLALVIVGCPVLLLLPLDAMVRDWRGPTLFYAWSLAETALVVVVTRLDGGTSARWTRCSSSR